jgi:hypothetical protein
MKRIGKAAGIGMVLAYACVAAASDVIGLHRKGLKPQRRGSDRIGAGVVAAGPRSGDQSRRGHDAELKVRGAQVHAIEAALSPRPAKTAKLRARAALFLRAARKHSPVGVSCRRPSAARKLVGAIGDSRTVDCRCARIQGSILRVPEKSMLAVSLRQRTHQTS